MEYISFHKVDPEEWDSLVKSSPDGSVFALSSWRTVILNVDRWALCDCSFSLMDKGRLLGVMPLQYSPTQQTMASTGWGGCGPIAAANLGHKQRRKVIAALLNHAEELAQKHGAQSLYFTVPPVVQTSIETQWGVNPYCEFGFEDVSGTSRVVNLSQDEDILWKACSETARHAIKKARQNGYTVSLSPWNEELDNYYKIHVENYERTGVVPHPKKYFQGIAEDMASDGYYLLWSCKDSSGNVVAYHNSCVFGNAGFYNTGCSSSESLTAGVNYLLFWEAFLGLKKHGLAWYDCGEIFPHASGQNKKKLEGLSTFKTKFGGENHRYFKCKKTLKHLKQVNKIQEPTIKETAKDFLIAGKKLVEKILGKKAANASALLIRFILNIVRKTIHWILRPSKLPFIRPFWGMEELLAVFKIHRYSKSIENAKSLLKSQQNVTEESVFLTSSGRGGIELALRAAMNLEPNKKTVILPSYACKGVVDPILRCGLTPVFVDVDANLFPDQDYLIKLAPGALACIFPFLCGAFVDITETRERVKAQGVFWIGDYCQAYKIGLSQIQGDDFSIFSFGGGKSLTATAGGAVITSTKSSELMEEYTHIPTDSFKHALARLIRQLILYFFPPCCSPIAKKLFKRSATRQFKLQKISQLDAIILCEQLKKASIIIERRTRNALQLLAKREEVDDAYFQKGHQQVFTKLSCITRSKQAQERLFEAAQLYNVEIEWMYAPLHTRLNEHCHSNGNCLAEKLDSRVFNIPVRPNLSSKELNRLKSLLKHFSTKCECKNE